MKKNVGSNDQLIRFLIAFIAFSLYLTDVINSWWALVALAILMATAFFNFCPLYFLLGINTRNRKKRL